MIRKRSSIDDAIIIDVPPLKSHEPCVPFRYFVMFMILICAIIGYAIKSVINVAILTMVDDSDDPDDSLVSKYWLTSFHPTGGFNLTISKTFKWDQKDQALILGGYFYTYTASQIIGGVITDKVNIVLLLVFTQSISSICTLLTPLAASTNIYCLVTVRAIIGLVHGATLPGCLNLIENWFTPAEISMAQSLLSVGCNLGIALTAPLTAWLCQTDLWGGWPSSFIILGIANSVFVLVFYLTISNNPYTNRWTSKWEKSYLSRVVVNKSSTYKKKIATPWIKLFTSLPLWAVFWCRGLTGVTYYAVNSKIPVYIEKILHQDITHNGLINCSFYLVVSLAQLITGPLAKFIILRGWLSKTITRKIFQSFVCLGLAFGLVLVTFLGDRPVLAIITLIVSMFFYGFDAGGDVPVVPEMAPSLVGTSFGFVNTLRSASGFIAPALIGYILGEQTDSQSKWFFTFYILAGLQVVGLVIFLVFVTAEPLPWATIKRDDEDNCDTTDSTNSDLTSN